MHSLRKRKLQLIKKPGTVLGSEEVEMISNTHTIKCDRKKSSLLIYVCRGYNGGRWIREVGNQFYLEKNQGGLPRRGEP